MKKEKVLNITTEDGFKLYGFFQYPDIQKEKYPVVIFAHQFGTTHVIWHDLAKEFLDLGYAVFLMDLRGHGLSIYQNGKVNRIVFREKYESILDLINFFKKSWKKVGFEKIPDDIVRWIKFLKENEKIDENKILLVGSSLGGISIIPVLSLENIFSFISISPGPEEIVGKERVYNALLSFEKECLFIASYNDLLNSKNIVDRLVVHMREGRAFFVTNKGHGIMLLPYVKEYIFTFVKNLIKEDL